jgi:RND family efflux transporter MFP subunit
MNAVTKIPLLFVIVSLVVQSCSEKSEENKLSKAGEFVPVRVASLRNNNVSDSIVTTGLLFTEQEARLSFKIGGIVHQIFVDEGQHFKKGQLLAVIKTNEIDAQLEQARLALEKARRDHVRTENLYKDSIATLEQFQNSQTALQLAQKTFDQIAFNRGYASIYAPAEGFVTKKIVNEGEIVTAGMPVLAISKIGHKSNWILKAGVTDEQWERIKINEPAAVQFDAFPGRRFDATVIRKSQAADPASGSLQVEIQIKFNQEKPAVGMFGKAVIHTQKQSAFNLIPYDAVIEADGNKAFVFSPSGNNEVKKIPVFIQSFNKDHVVIRGDSLNGANQIIISNSAFLNEQSKIIIVKEGE